MHLLLPILRPSLITSCISCHSPVGQASPGYLGADPLPALLRCNIQIIQVDGLAHPGVVDVTVEREPD